MMLVDLRGMEISGKELQNRCDEVYITLNKNTVPNAPRSPFVTSGVRIGTPADTTRGLVEEDMDKIAECIWLAATDFEAKADYIRAEVTKICQKYPLYQQKIFKQRGAWPQNESSAAAAPERNLVCRGTFFGGENPGLLRYFYERKQKSAGNEERPETECAASENT